MVNMEQAAKLTNAETFSPATDDESVSFSWFFL